MPQLPAQGSTERVELPSSANLPETERAWVIIQNGRILAGDLEQVDDPENKMSVSLSILAGRIKEWNFTEPDGLPTPITFDNIKRLELDDIMFLFNKLDLQQSIGMTPEEKKSSEPSSEPTLTA